MAGIFCENFDEEIVYDENMIYEVMDAACEHLGNILIWQASPGVVQDANSNFVVSSFRLKIHTKRTARKRRFFDADNSKIGI